MSEGKVGGLLIAFTNAQKRDKFNQFFTRSTDFKLELFGDNQTRPVDYHHNFGELFGAIGHIRSIEVRDEGLYAETELDTTHTAYPFIRSMVEEGKLGYSAETLPNWMQVASDGHVSVFPIVAAALTPKASAPEGMTKVGILRGLGFEGIEGNDDDQVAITRRSVWDYPQEQLAPATPPAPARMPSISYEQALRGQQGFPRPQLPSSAQGGAAFNFGLPQVSEMKSPIDQLPLVSVLGWYTWSQAATAGKHMRPQFPDGMNREQFMKGLADRVIREYQTDDNKLYLRSQEIVVDAENVVKTPSDWDILSPHFSKMTGGKEYKTAHHLRANEVMQSTLDDYGDEWVFTAWSLEVWRNIRMMAKVFPLFSSFNMPSNPFTWPKVGTLGYARKVAETTAQTQLSMTASPYPLRKLSTDGSFTFSIPAKAGLITTWSDELRKWSQINVVEELQFAMMEMFAHTADRLVLRGDETDANTNISWYDVGGTTPTADGTNDYLLLLDGLVHKCVVDGTGQTTDKADAAFATNDVNVNTGKMGILGLYPQDLVLICDTTLAHKFKSLSEVLTVDKYGPNATIHTGEIGKIMGIPIVPSEDMGLTLGTSGRIDQTAGNNTQLNFMVVNRKTVKIGRAWDVEIDMFRLPYSDVDYIKGRMGFDLALMQANGVSYTYDIDNP